MRKELFAAGMLLLLIGFTTFLQTRTVDYYCRSPGGELVEMVIQPRSEYSQRIGISDSKTKVEIEVTAHQRAIVKVRSQEQSIFKRVIGPGSYSWNVTLAEAAGRYSLIIANPNRSTLHIHLLLRFYVLSTRKESPYAAASCPVVLFGLLITLVGVGYAPTSANLFDGSLYFFGTALFLHIMGSIFRVPPFFFSALLTYISAYTVLCFSLLFRWTRSTRHTLSWRNHSAAIAACLSAQTLTAAFLVPIYIGRTGLITERETTHDIVEANPLLGVCDHLEPGTDENAIRDHFELIRSLGANWVRLDMSWEQIEPYKGVWSFDFWDSLVRISSHYGLRILPVISRTPCWASLRPDSDTYHAYPPADIGDFREFLQKVVERYGRRIYYWEVWNEPDAQYWMGSPQEYCRLLQEAKSVLKALDPAAITVLGGISWTGLSFLEELITLNALDAVDIVGIHLYGQDADEVLRRFERLQIVINQSGIAKPIWITEIGYSTSFGYETEKRQAEFLEKTFTALSTNPRVQRVFWYELKDSGLILFWPEHNFGLVRFDMIPKASFKAYSRMARDFVSGGLYEIRKT